jgi:hypothetical protein
MGRGGHGLPKVSPGPAMPYPFTPCRRVTPETTLQPFQGWPARRGGWPAVVFYTFGRPTPYPYGSGLGAFLVSSQILRRNQRLNQLLSGATQREALRLTEVENLQRETKNKEGNFRVLPTSPRLMAATLNPAYRPGGRWSPIGRFRILLFRILFDYFLVMKFIRNPP